MATQTFTRRNFLKMAGLAGAGAGLAAACSPAAAPAPTPTAMPGMTESAGGTEDMDALHEAGVKTFVDHAGKDASFWKHALEYQMDGEVKVFEVTTREMQWLVAPGQAMPAMAYNERVPGPEIRVVEGDKVRVVLKNEMEQSTSIHFHGVIVPNNMDGVPFITQPPVKKGGTFTYEFTAKNPGSHMYHSHHNAAEQVTKGLMGAFIIEPKDKSTEPPYDNEYTMILNDAGIGLTINGKSFPYTQPIIAKLGEKIRIRHMNEGLQIHPMHLHGIPQCVFAKDGWALPQPYMCDTLNVAPGERYDVLVEASDPGVWAFHCHILTHAESAHGMFGMVTAMIVNA